MEISTRKDSPFLRGLNVSFSQAFGAVPGVPFLGIPRMMLDFTSAALVGWWWFQVILSFMAWFFWGFRIYDDSSHLWSWFFLFEDVMVILKKHSFLGAIFGERIPLQGWNISQNERITVMMQLLRLRVFRLDGFPPWTLDTHESNRCLAKKNRSTGTPKTQKWEIPEW